MGFIPAEDPVLLGNQGNQRGAGRSAAGRKVALDEKPWASLAGPHTQEKRGILCP